MQTAECSSVCRKRQPWFQATNVPVYHSETWIIKMSLDSGPQPSFCSDLRWTMFTYWTLSPKGICNLDTALGLLVLSTITASRPEKDGLWTVQCWHARRNLESFLHSRGRILNGKGEWHWNRDNFDSDIIFKRKSLANISLRTQPHDRADLTKYKALLAKILFWSY